MNNASLKYVPARTNESITLPSIHLRAYANIMCIFPVCYQNHSLVSQMAETYPLSTSKDCQPRLPPAMSFPSYHRGQSYTHGRQRGKTNINKAHKRYLAFSWTIQGVDFCSVSALSLTVRLELMLQLQNKLYNSDIAFHLRGKTRQDPALLYNLSA